MADEIVQGDTTPPYQSTLEDANGPVALPAGTLVRFLMAPDPAMGGVGVTIARDAVIVNTAAVVGDPDLGVVQYQWQTGDTAVPGIYRVQWEVQWPSADIETFPDGYNELVILRKVA